MQNLKIPVTFGAAELIQSKHIRFHLEVDWDQLAEMFSPTSLIQIAVFGLA